jgi:Protein of unknown function (DUF1254)
VEDHLPTPNQSNTWEHYEKDQRRNLGNRVPSGREFGCISTNIYSQTTLVTVENYNRAQTDVNFAGVVKNGGLGKFRHGRELAPPAQQGIVRPNRDTLYSFAIVDLDAGPVTITLPEAGKRFMGMQVVNQDQYTPATHLYAKNMGHTWGTTKGDSLVANRRQNKGL